MAIGTSGNCFKNAPVIGAIMAQLVGYVEGGADHDTTPLQFPLQNIGGTANVGAYSRLRDPHSTTGSVIA